MCLIEMKKKLIIEMSLNANSHTCWTMDIAELSYEKWTNNLQSPLHSPLLFLLLHHSANEFFFRYSIARFSFHFQFVERFLCAGHHPVFIRWYLQLHNQTTNSLARSLSFHFLSMVTSITAAATSVRHVVTFTFSNIVVENWKSFL